MEMADKQTCVGVRQVHFARLHNSNVTSTLQNTHRDGDVHKVRGLNRAIERQCQDTSLHEWVQIIRLPGDRQQRPQVSRAAACEVLRWEQACCGHKQMHAAWS